MQILTFTRAATAGLAAAALTAAGAVLGAAPADATPVSTWDRLAQCESSGNWHIDTGNGYYGGLQFSMGTWLGHGGSGNPAAASKATQIKIAERVLDSQGWGAWPACSAKLGLRGGSTAAATGQADRTPQHRASTAATRGTHVVVRGETLAGIAAAHHVRGGWARLADVNRLADPNVIRVGQQLRLPA